jgi:hypothetical protein
MVGKGQIGAHHCHIGLEGMPAVQSPPVRRPSKLGLSCLWNEAYDVKAHSALVDGLARKNTEKWRKVALFSNGLAPFQDVVMQCKSS